MELRSIVSKRFTKGLTVVLLLVLVWAESKDYYKLLGVSREATTREIRQAFKQLALTMHPDKNPVSDPQSHVIHTIHTRH